MATKDPVSNPTPSSIASHLGVQERNFPPLIIKKTPPCGKHIYQSRVKNTIYVFKSSNYDWYNIFF